MTWGKVLGWSSLLALVGGGTAIVVMAALWGGTPVRELPLVVLSMLVGGFMPPTAAAVHRRSGPTRSRPESPARAGHATAPSHASSPPETSDVMEFVSELRSSTSGGLRLFLVLAGLFVGGAGAAMLVSPGVRASIIKAYPSPDVLTALPLAGLLLLMALLSFLVGFGGSAPLRFVTVSSAGTTVAFGKFTADIPWTDVHAIAVRDHHLLFTVPAMPKDKAVLLNRTVSLGEGHGFGEQLWTPKTPMVAICDLRTLTVGEQLLLDEVKHHSGLGISER